MSRLTLTAVVRRRPSHDATVLIQHTSGLESSIESLSAGNGPILRICERLGGLARTEPFSPTLRDRGLQVVIVEISERRRDAIDVTSNRSNSSSDVTSTPVRANWMPDAELCVVAADFKRRLQSYVC
jgi:hypothetical protein